MIRMGQAIAFREIRKSANQNVTTPEPVITNQLATPQPLRIHACDAKNEGKFVELLGGRTAFVAASPAMREVRRQVEQVSDTDAAVLLLGESGTGKEVVARLIHSLSCRAPKRFLKVNCAALPVDLLESELFGHEAGAFTSAHQAKAGKFEACDKGTILLDEVGEMPTSLQAKLLHVLQDGEFSRLGSTSTVRVNVRVLAATNVNVKQAVQAGTFRRDLYFRLNVLTIQLPPLRERKEDLPHLLNYMMTTWAASYGRPRLPITRRILDASASYAWPGNVRELESFVKRYLVLGNEDDALHQLDGEKGTERGLHVTGRTDSVNESSEECVNLKSRVQGLKCEAECSAILQALDLTNGCKQEAAKLLGISQRAFHYKIRQYDIRPRYEAKRPA